MKSWFLFLVHYQSQKRSKSKIICVIEANTTQLANKFQFHVIFVKSPFLSSRVDSGHFQFKIKDSVCVGWKLDEVFSLLALGLNN